MKNLFPTRIVFENGVENVQSLLTEKTLQIGLGEFDVAKFKKNSSVILDFGKEISGSLRFLNYTTKGSGKVSIRLGESVSEVCHAIGECNATNDHAARDWEFFIPSFSDQTFFNSGFRFAKIEVSEDTEIAVKSILAVSDEYEKEFDGSFSCDDDLVNKIFDVAAYTFKLCIHNGVIWDGIKRDRLVWIGDIHPEQMTANCLYSDTFFIKNSIDFARVQTPLPAWVSGMPAYSLWWIINLRDYYFRTGDKEFLLAQKDYLVKLVEQIDGCISDNGDLNLPNYFVDWPTHPWTDDQPLSDKSEDNDLKIVDEAVGMNAIAIWSVKAAKELLKELGESVEFVDSAFVKLSKKSYTVAKFKQISALRLMVGIGDDADVKKVLDGGARGLSTFMSYYLFKSVADKGYGTEALSMMKEYYGKMLELGATTFWEDFDIEWAKNASRIDELPKEGMSDIHAERGAFCYKGLRHSFCHGWASGVVPFLMKFVAGIEEKAIGGKEITVNPHLCGLEYVNVVYPTVLGNVKISVRKVNGKTETEVDAPDGVKVSVL